MLQTQEVGEPFTKIQRLRLLPAICVPLLIFATVSVMVSHREGIYQEERRRLLASYKAGHDGETITRAQQMIRDSGSNFDAVMDNYGEAREHFLYRASRSAMDLPAADRRAHARFLRAVTLYRQKRYAEAESQLRQIQAEFITQEKVRLQIHASKWNKELGTPMNERWLRSRMPYKA